MAPGHVPAWRKLGLKLKNAKNLAETTNSLEYLPPTADLLVPGSNKRSLPQPNSGTRKQERLVSLEHIKPLGSGEDHDTTGQQLQVHKHSKLNERKKPYSVSITSSTKPQNDEWSDERTSQNQRGGSKFAKCLKLTNISQVDGDSFEDPLNNAKKSKWDENKKKSLDSSDLHSQHIDGRSETERPNEVASNSQHLIYLDQYYNSRHMWKFNKARQNYVLKHAFNLEEIPPSYDQSLYHYAMGLKGQQAVERLHLKARNAIESNEHHFEQYTQVDQPESENEPEGSQPDAKSATYLRTQYREALIRVKEQIRSAEIVREEGELIKDPGWRKQFFRRRRAEILFWSTERDKLDTMIPHPRPGKVVYEGVADSAGAEVENATTESAHHTMRREPVGGVGITIRHKRFRKRRTGVPDDDTSSDETTSSSGTSGNCSDVEDNTKFHTLNIDLQGSSAGEKVRNVSKPSKTTTEQSKRSRKRKRKKVVNKSSDSSEGVSDRNITAYGSNIQSQSG